MAYEHLNDHWIAHIHLSPRTCETVCSLKLYVGYGYVRRLRKSLKIIGEETMSLSPHADQKRARSPLAAP
jgi:hypothetical protein